MDCCVENVFSKQMHILISIKGNDVSHMDCCKEVD